MAEQLSIRAGLLEATPRVGVPAMYPLEGGLMLIGRQPGWGMTVCAGRKTDTRWGRQRGHRGEGDGMKETKLVLLARSAAPLLPIVVRAFCDV
jgi:hypothetical protein